MNEKTKKTWKIRLGIKFLKIEVIRECPNVYERVVMQSTFILLPIQLILYKGR